MSGTKAGSIKAVKKIKDTYGEGYFAKIGRMGGKTPTKTPKGFASMPKEKVSAAGRKGGTISRRGEAKPYDLRKEYTDEINKKLVAKGLEDSKYAESLLIRDPLQGLTAHHVEIKKKWWRFGR